MTYLLLLSLTCIPGSRISEFMFEKQPYLKILKGILKHRKSDMKRNLGSLTEPHLILLIHQLLPV